LVAANPFSAPYLEVKRKILRHELPSGVFHQKPTNDGGAEPPVAAAAVAPEDAPDPAAAH